jgi:choline dehydrogenase-like flavoprotein
MQHPRGCIGAIEADVPVARRLQRLFNYFLRPSRTPIEYDVGFALTDEAQREHGLLNASVFVRYARGEQTAWEAAKRLRSALAARSRYDDLVADGTRVLGLPSEVPNVARRFLGFPLSHKRPVIRAFIDLEQEPTRESRLTLSDERDALGCRRVQADWRISPLERRTAAFFGQFLHEELALLGLGRFKPADWLTSGTPLTDDHLIGTYHFIGTTRMSDDPREGVVNSDCRTHGIDNLYLAGCSVFPTGGHANPTLTIVALAIRLADHLRVRLRP